MHYFRYLCLILLSAFCLTAYSAPQSLTNYLGTGSNPKLHLELSKDNGPGWKPFTIDYQQSGNIPWSADSKKDWSPWNVKDTEGNYYGTITLHSDGNKASFEKYTGSQLEGIHFSFNGKSYQLSVDKIYPINPFPDAPIAQPAKQTDGSSYTFSTKNGNIINSKNQIVRLKGVARPSLEWNPKGQFLSKDDIQKMAQWGSNVIRIDLNQDYWFKSNSKMENGSYKQIIDAIIYYATVNKMAVILDLHWVNDKVQQTQMANRDSIKFWQQVANEYKNFGTVIFELYNEPHDIAPEIWLNGNAEFAGYQEMLNAVRSTGANNLCIVNGLDYGYDLNSVSNYPLTGTNIIYGSHPYTTKGEDGYPIEHGGSFKNNFKNILGKYPIIFTEFGVNDSSYYPNGFQQKYINMLNEIEKDNINYTGFAWWVEPNNPAFPTLIGDWEGNAINGGELVQQNIKNNPPTPLDIH